MAEQTIITGLHPQGGWQNRGEGSRRAANIHLTEAAARRKGRDMAISRKTEHVIQDRDGKIQRRNSYGNDPRVCRDDRRSARGRNDPQPRAGTGLSTGRRHSGWLILGWNRPQRRIARLEHLKQRRHSCEFQHPAGSAPLGDDQQKILAPLHRPDERLDHR
jgi:hypothetical protein